MWNIKCYVSDTGKSDVQDTYDSSTDELKATFESAIEYLRNQERQSWRRPYAHRLNKCSDFKDFFEVRFCANKLQQRPIGYFGPGKNDFTILFWATEKGGKLIPQDWCSKADRRRIQIGKGTANVKDLKFDTD